MTTKAPDICRYEPFYIEEMKKKKADNPCI
jgi:hypothetical protein